MSCLCSFGERFAGVAAMGFIVILGFVARVKKDERLTDACVDLLEQL